MRMSVLSTLALPTPHQDKLIPIPIGCETVRQHPNGAGEEEGRGGERGGGREGGLERGQLDTASIIRRAYT